MNPLIIFDIDGTIADLDHRLPFIHFNASMHGFEKDWSPDWKGFHANVKDDIAIPKIIYLMHMLMESNDIWFFTGRMETSREDTIAWIKKNTVIKEPNITMRPNGDTRPDYELKQSMLDSMLIDDRQRLICVFDDRDQVVAMWRRNNVICLQVREGDY